MENEEKNNTGLNGNVKNQQNIENKKSMMVDSDELFRMQKKLNKSFTKNVILSIFCIICVLIFLLEGALVYIIYQKNQGFFNIISNNNNSINNEINEASISSIKKELNMEEFMDKLAYVEYLVNHAYYYEKDGKKIEDGMFAGYVAALGDKYAQYFPRQEYTDFVQTATGEYYGIGCVCTQNYDTMAAIITEVYEGSPAEKAGIMEGDILLSVDDVDVSDMELSDIVTLIKGEENTPVRIGVYRIEAETYMELTAYRGKVEIKSVSSKKYEGNIGYIKVNEFTGKALEQFKQKIDTLQSENVKGVIIDLRNNPGGELSIVLNMVDYIMKDADGTYTLNQKEDNFDVGRTLVVYMKDKHTIVESFYCEDGHEINLPIVILVNENSASASELFTRCMMDYKKAIVVGAKTYGKGVVQNMIPLNDGSAIKFTVSEYFPPSGYSIDHHGVIPDYCLDELGDELKYDNNGILIVDNEENDDTSTEKSEAVNLSHEENKKIYDMDNQWIESDWYQQMDVDYEDKQLLQAIILLR